VIFSKLTQKQFMTLRRVSVQTKPFRLLRLNVHQLQTRCFVSRIIGTRTNLPSFHKTFIFPINSYFSAISRTYSDRSHYSGVIFNQHFLHNAFMRALFEMELLALGDSNENVRNIDKIAVRKLETAFRMFSGVLKAHSKLEENGMLLALHERIHTQEQKQLLASFRPDHVREHQQLHHIQNCINRVLKSENSRIEHADELREAISKLANMLNEHFDRYATLLTPLYADLFKENEIKDIHADAMLKFEIDKIEFEEEHENDVDPTAANDILYMFSNYELVTQMVREILSLMAKQSDGIVLKTILKELRKTCPSVVWREIEIKIPQLADLELESFGV
jgi:hypothetical protein